ncbi:MAG: hypothetical protein N2036_02050 [Bryobacteraceae bacterium]|nr:hypothetical protein [Bryobacteraceae bacterium]MCX7602835.1 hypothetical protein [Bryobacteraceae bacterium]
MNGMEQFERQLRDTFRRVEPPAGLEQKILERVRPRPARRLPGWLAVAASLLLVAGGTLGLARWREQRLRAQQAEHVRQQLAVTLEITARTIAKAEGRLRSIGIERIQIEEASWQEH